MYHNTKENVKYIKDSLDLLSFWKSFFFMTNYFYLK